MIRHSLNKQERVVEAVRQGLEGPAAVDFIHQSGYAISVPGIARYLRQMGGKAKVQDLISQGLRNAEILHVCLPEADVTDIPVVPPSQQELFGESAHHPTHDIADDDNHPLYDTVKISLRLPADLYEAIRLASKGEHVTQNALIVDILTSALSRMPQSLHDIEANSNVQR